MRTIESIFNEYDYGITEDKQDFIRLNHGIGGLSVLDLAKHVFGKQDINERSEEVKKIKLFLVKLNKKHVPLELDDAQRKLIRDLAPSEKPIEIARKVFQNNNLVPLGKEVKTVDKYIKVLGLGREDVTGKIVTYSAPVSMQKLIKKVNFSKPELRLDEEKLGGAHKKYLEQLKSFLSNPRFVVTINAIRNPEEKDLFEHTFIEGVFGKELNSEEINMYISLCSDYVLQKQIKEQLDMLNDELSSCFGSDDDDAKTLKMSLTEAFGKKSSEYDNCSKRILKLQTDLSGVRSKRMENQAALAASLVSFVEAWKSEDERKRAAIVSRATQKKVRKELEDVEDTSEYVARILGINKEEILNG